MNLTTMRSLVRRDLKDEDSANYRWTNDEIDRAIQRAVDEFSKYNQAEQKTDIVTVSGNRDLSIASLSGLIAVDAVEFPKGYWPKSFVSFSIYQTTLSMEVLGDGTSATLYWRSVHTLNTSTSTIPVQYESLIALGASGYAVLVWSQYGTNRQNIAGDTVDRDYLYWGKGREMEFQKELKRISKKLKQGTLYAIENDRDN